MIRKPGSALKVGDVMDAWWRPGRDQITALEDYTGPLAYLWAPDLAQLASLALNKVGMTIEPQILYEVLGETGEDKP